jgi:hypothetical protein
MMSDRKLTTWSFSRLKDYEKCPWQLWLKAGEKRDMSHVDTTAMDRGSMVHNACEDFVKGKGDFIKEMSKFADYFKEVKLEYEAGDVMVEEDWGFDADWQPIGWFDPNVKCRMKLDNFRVTARNEEGHPVAGIPTDYKTGKKFGNEVTHNQQGQLYAIGSFLRIPTLELAEVEFIYLDHAIKSKRKVYTREKAMRFLPTWQARADKLLNDREFRPKPNKINCKWCPFGPQNGDSSCDWGVDA